MADPRGKTRSSWRGFVRASSLLLAFAGACAPAERPPEFSARDSLGITIVEAPTGIWASAPAWSVGEGPIVAIGGDNEAPGHQLNGVAGAFRLSDGRIVVGDRGSREIRYFSSDGSHERSVGGPGGGPGELSRILMGLERLPGDTLVASDWPFGTLSRFDAQGEYLRGEVIGPYLPGLVSRVLADGSLLKDLYPLRSYGNEIEMFAARGEDGHFRARGAILHHPRGAEQADTLREIVGEEFFKVTANAGRPVVRRMPFGRVTLVAPAAERMYVADTGEREVEAWTYDGSMRSLIRWEEEDVPVTSDDRDRFESDVMTAAPAGREADFQRWLAEVPYPDSKAPMEALFAEPDGHLWVRLSSENRQPSVHWIVFNPQGEPTATIDLPRRLQLMDIGADYLVGVTLDELDVESVLVYELAR